MGKLYLRVYHSDRKGIRSWIAEIIGDGDVPRGVLKSRSGTAKGKHAHQENA